MSEPRYPAALVLCAGWVCLTYLACHGQTTFALWLAAETVVFGGVLLRRS